LHVRITGLALALALVAGCAHGRSPYPTADSSLGLDRVVLYRNGVGYFERRGEVKGDALVIKVRKDQVNDVLKSLTVVDRKNGQAVSVSMPLDPQSWANAALSTLAPGQGSLAQVLDALRGTAVVLGTTRGRLRGRVVIVEEVVDEPDATPPPSSERATPPRPGSRDFKVTLLDGKKMEVVRLSQVRSVTLQDGDLALQFHRSLDATAGEGMFQQVAVEIRLAGASSHDLVVSYVVAAPMWKPTYRVVLPEPGAKSPALLQGWAVVDNTSGEEWTRVAMSLTSGAPIAFRYDLHTPREIPRSDLTEAGVAKRVKVAVGETSIATESDEGPDADGDAIADHDDRCPTSPEVRNGYQDEDGCPDEIPTQLAKFTGTIKGIYFDGNSASIKDKQQPVLDRAIAVLKEFPGIDVEVSGHCSSEENPAIGQRRAEAVRDYLIARGIARARIQVRSGGVDEPVDTNKTSAGRAKNRRIEFTILVDRSPAQPTTPPPPPSRGAPKRDLANRGAGASAGEAAPALDLESLRRSTQASARAKSVSGLTRIDLGERVTVPDGSSTMVAIINQDVAAEQTFLYRPGGAGSGYEQNPYRVVRFKNTTPFVLEPGPISIYAGGSFVGEGISEAVGTNTSTTIPFAVEPAILVSSAARYSGEDMRIVRIVRGVIEVENFQRVATTWTVKGRLDAKGYSVLVRHPKQGGAYALKSRIEGAEELPDAYLVPVAVAAGAGEGTLEVVEQTPSRSTVTIWDGRAPELLDAVLKLPGLDPAARAKIEPIVRLRQEIGRIDTEVDGLTRQQAELDQRAYETRNNLEAIKKDPRAADLRARLSKRLEEFARDGDKLGRDLVELQSKRLGKKIELEDALQLLDLSVPAP
jgi:outer membrane protein OmpA-like peptidoglycan-associated protein